MLLRVEKRELRDSGKVSIKLDEKDELIGVKLCTIDDDILLSSSTLNSEELNNEELNIEELYNKYKLNSDIMAKAKKNMIVLHPLPRNNEIDKCIDADTRCAYFRQMKYGVYVRMALLEMLLDMSK